MQPITPNAASASRLYAHTRPTKNTAANWPAAIAATQSRTAAFSPRSAASAASPSAAGTAHSAFF